MFTIRAELPGHLFHDYEVPGKTLVAARDRFATAHPELMPFDWRGAVVFCGGARPAEDFGPDGKIFVNIATMSQRAVWNQARLGLRAS